MINSRIIHILLGMILLTSVEASTQETSHLVLIGIDGFSSRALQHSDMPTVRLLIEQGSSTLSKRSVLPSSSAPNWASMFMGVPTEIHGYTQWGSKSPEIPSYYTYENNIFPTIFQILREHKPNINQGYAYEWEGMKYLADTLSFDFHQVARDYLTNKTLLADIACEYIEKNKPGMMAIIFASPDDIGHKYGFESMEYYQELNHIDSEIARIIQSYKRVGIAGETVFIISSDHGGINNGHGGITLEELETPFIIVGNKIKENYEIDGLMMQYDVAPTIAEIFGIDIPDIWRGKSIYNQIYSESSASSFELKEGTYPEIYSHQFYDIQGNKYRNKPSQGIVIEQIIYTVR